MGSTSGFMPEFRQQPMMTNNGMPAMHGAMNQQVFSPMGVTPGVSQLQLLLPSRVVQGTLVPNGHLAEIAKGCSVHIDLCDEVAPSQLRVVLSGSIVANSLAALALQMRIWFAEGR